MSLRILEVYGSAALQGAPKHGRRCFGVPPGGAFDQESFLLANALSRNQTPAPVIEFALAVAKLEILQTSLISIVGAECDIAIDGRPVQCQSAYQLIPGQIVDIDAPTTGCRVYVALHGITTKEKFDQQLVKGYLIQANAHTGPPGKIGTLPHSPSSIQPKGIRVISEEQLPRTSLTVSIKSSRVGVRLEGMQCDPGEEKLSEPSCPGAIQVTNDGALVIHGADGPTIGGYKKLGVVCSADLDRVGQLRPGDQISMQTITQEQAVAAWHQRQKGMEEKLSKLLLH